MATIIDIKLPKAIAAALRIPENNPQRQQLRVLKKLIKKARFTEFGQYYLFDEILFSNNVRQTFQELVPVHDYNKIYDRWWKKTLDGVPDVTWPGKIKYYALSSGTSEAASKYIPITRDMLRSNTVNYIRQLITLFNYEKLPRNAMTKGFLMIGGTTDLQKGKAGWYAGDLSGILAKKRPFWFQSFYRPGGHIAAIKDWNQKLNEIVEHAKEWEKARGMRLIANYNIYMEFVPFDEKNFDSDGKMVDNPMALTISEVEEDKDYALLISTNAGAWRYLLGDTIRFVNKERIEVVITGRTKHFLSLVGEHLSVENMTKAVEVVSNEMNISIPEFTVVGFPYQTLFAHKWYIACNDMVDSNEVIKRIDKQICILNDDYAVE